MTRTSRTDTAHTARTAALAADRALLTVTAVAIAAGALVAACAPDPARSPGGERERTPASSVVVERALHAAGAQAPGHAVWVPNPRWVAGDRGAEPFVRALEWIAPAGPASAPRGTVTVWQDPAGDGGVTLAATDDDAALAAALATVGPADTLVRDRADWLLVTADRIRPLLPPLPPGTGPTVGEETTVAGFRDLLVRRAEAAARGGGPVGG